LTLIPRETPRSHGGEERELPQARAPSTSYDLHSTKQHSIGGTSSVARDLKTEPVKDAAVAFEPPKEMKKASKWAVLKQPVPPKDPPGLSHAWTHVTDVALDAAHVLKDLMESVRRIMTEREGMDLKEIFQYYDKDQSGDIDKDELRGALESMHINLSEAALGIVYGYFNRNGYGCDYGEFCKVFFNRRSMGKLSAAEKVQLKKDEELRNELSMVT